MSVILGPMLLLCIVIATVNMMSTYKGIHHEKQATLWNVIQLDREIGNTLFSANQFINNDQTRQQFDGRFVALSNSFSGAVDAIERDTIFQQIDGISTSIQTVQYHIDSAQSLILEAPTIDKARLYKWVNELNAIKRMINILVLDVVASNKGAYSERAFKKIIKTAGILLALILTFILYLGHLLFELRKERKRNLYMLAHDPLTGLSSRECVMTSLQSRCNNKKPFALLLFDLNKFKAVNDNFGHHTGDQLLIHLAEKFKQTIGKYGIVGRLGGDEFVWLAESDNPKVIERQYAQFLEAIREPCIIKGMPLQIHISSGGGIAADYQYHATQLLERVDEAMYKAKSRQVKEIVWENQTKGKMEATVAAKSAAGKQAKRSRRIEPAEA